jgi:hypothetical protein
MENLTLKLSKKELKTADIAYIYSDNHCVIIHKEYNKKSDSHIQWATIWENIGIRVSFDKPGRLIVKKEALNFLIHARSIEAHSANVKNGSQKTKEKEIAVETISLYPGPFIIYNIPELLGSDIYYNDASENFDDVKNNREWSIYHIAEINEEPKVNNL